ncbi:MAG: sulfatase family protein [Promethearchaeota archaeon]
MIGWYIAGAIITLFIGNYIRKRFRDMKKRDMNIRGHQRYLESLNGILNARQKTKKPNIIIFFMDDMGFADISCYGAKNIHTPNIDNLADNGVKFDSFYSSSPVCSPSRAGLLTGRYPLRMHIPNVFFPKKSPINFILKFLIKGTYGVKGLLEDEITIPEALKQVGYSTGMLGKWHLGDESPHIPNDKGFDFFYGAYYSNDMKPYAIWRNKEIDQPAPADQDHLTKSLTREGIKFIRDNKDKPFFLYYCQPFPHHPLHASEDFRGTSNGGLYGDAVQEVDWSVGEILKVLDELNIRDNTFIIFTSDNGPWHEGNPGYHRGRKGLPFEGGQRVPMIASWLGKIPKGIQINEMAMNIDFFPTILKMVGIPPPNDRIIDGKDIMPLLTGEINKTPHDYLYYHWGRKILAIRDRDYKYHTKHKSDNSTYSMINVQSLLFDMKSYDQESYDQSTRRPDKVEELKSKLEEFESSLNKNPRGWIKK